MPFYSGAQLLALVMNSNIYAKCVARAQRESAGCFSCPYESSFLNWSANAILRSCIHLTHAKCLPAALVLRSPADSGLGWLTAVIRDRLLASRLHS